MKPGLTWILVGANVLLAALLGWLWLGPAGPGRGIHWTAPPALKPDLGTASAAAIGQDDADTARFMAILDRPLFSTTRRPAPVVAKGAGPDPMQGIHLFGLFTGPDGGGALVRVDGRTRRLKRGEAVGDWSLQEVRSRDVVFARGPETRVVPLLQARQGVSAPGATAAGPSAPSTASAAPPQIRLAPVPGPGGTMAAEPGLGLFTRRVPVPGQPSAPAAAPTPAPAAPSPAPVPAAPPTPVKPQPATGSGGAAPSGSPFTIGGSR
jgi:hypothetical protein